jgi:hypothetical protein
MFSRRSRYQGYISAGAFKKNSGHINLLGLLYPDTVIIQPYFAIDIVYVMMIKQILQFQKRFEDSALAKFEQYINILKYFIAQSVVSVQRECQGSTVTRNQGLL